MNDAAIQDERFRKAVDACPMAFWSLTLDGRVAGANRAAAEACGEDGSLHPWRDCWPEEARFSVDRVLKIARQGQAATFRAHLTWGARGRIFAETVVTPVFGPDGAPEALSACMRDITAEWDESQFLNSVIQLLPFALTVRDMSSGIYVLSNSVAEQILEAGPEGLVGRTLDEVCEPARAALIAQYDAEALRLGRASVVVDSFAQDSLGRRRKFSSTRVATYDDSGPRYLIALTEDITEAEAAAESLRQALQQAEQANQAKAAFLANISHEIRTPLNGMVAGADMLAQQALPSSAGELVELIRASSLALELKLQNVLELVNIDRGQASVAAAPFEVAELLRAAADGAWAGARAKGLDLRWDAGALTGAVYRGDAMRLRQVLDQLLGNAIKFTEHGGVALSAEACDGGLRVIVEDTGVGIDPEVRESLFDRFRRADDTLTRRQSGFGIGLALARELVALMGGRIDCRARPQGGSIFRFDAPLSLETAAPAAAPAAFAPPRILVADDHPTNRRVVEMVLGDLATVRSVNDGREAVEAFRQQPFDLVLMDIQMPNLDGVSAVAEIRKYEKAHNRSRTPIAMLTANTDPDNVAASRAAGADRHIAKPFTAAFLIGSVRELLWAPA